MMRKLVQHALSMVAVLVLLAVTAFPALQAAEPTADELAKDPTLFLDSARKKLHWDEPTEPAHLVGPIYQVGTKGLAVFLITTPEGHILLNTGMPGSGPLIEKSIRKLGLKPEEIKLLLTAHAHVDHVGGHAYLQKLSGAKVAVIRQEKELLESGGKTDFHYAGVKLFEFDPVKVDQVFEDGETIRLGNVALLGLLTGGHTRGSTSFVMKVTGNGKEWTVLFPNGTSVNPGYRLVKNPSYPGIREDYQRTLRVLEAQQPDIWLMPHNEAFGYEGKLARSKTSGAEAWVDPDGYRQWVVAQRQRFDAAIALESGADRPKK